MTTTHTTHLCDLATTKETLEHAIESLDALSEEISGVVARHAGEGPAVEAFARAWHDGYEPCLGELRAALERTRNDVFGQIGSLISGGA